MKEINLSPEELRRMEYELSELKGTLPTELTDVLEQAHNLLRPHITKELPMRQELSDAIEKLIYMQYPVLKPFAGSWPSKWIREISKNVALDLATHITLLFQDFAEGVHRTELYSNFEELVAFYTTPWVAHQREKPNFEGAPFWEQEKDSIIKEWEEDFEDSKITCETRNRYKTEFICALQPIIFKYYGDQTDTFTTEMWQHYGIIIGSAFCEYYDNCCDLECIIISDELTIDPGKGFYEYLT